MSTVDVETNLRDGSDPAADSMQHHLEVIERKIAMYHERVLHA